MIKGQFGKISNLLLGLLLLFTCLITIDQYRTGQRYDDKVRRSGELNQDRKLDDAEMAIIVHGEDELQKVLDQKEPNRYMVTKANHIRYESDSGNDIYFLWDVEFRDLKSNKLLGCDGNYVTYNKELGVGIGLTEECFTEQ